MRRQLWILAVLPLLHACQTDPKPQAEAAAITQASLQPGCLRPDFSSVPSLPEGIVFVAFGISVNAQGTPTAASVVTSSGSPAADELWVKALLRCKYSPAMADGRPLDSAANVSLGWNHRGSRERGVHRCMHPPYPREARRNNEQGTVVVGFVIDPATRDAQTQLVKSSGHPRLDDATKRAIGACLEHEEVRNDYPPGKPQSIMHEWRLRDP